MSQYDLCKDICSQSNISKIEKDQHIPSFFLLEKFAERLMVKSEYLYSGISSKEFEVIKSKLYKHLEKMQYQDIKSIVKNYDLSNSSNYEKKIIYWMKSIVSDSCDNDRNEAERYYLFAESIKSEIEDVNLEIGLLNLRTILYRKNMRHSEIKGIYNKIFSIIKKNEVEGKMVIKMLLSMSTYYYHKKEYELVNEVSTYALKIIRQTECTYLLDYHLYNASSSLYYLGRYNESEKEQLDMAIMIAKYNNNITLLEAIYDFVDEISCSEKVSS